MALTPAFAAPAALPARPRAAAPELAGVAAARTPALRAARGRRAAPVRAALLPPSWVRVAVGVAGVAAGVVLPNMGALQNRAGLTARPPGVSAVEKMAVRVVDGNKEGITLGALGIRQEDFLSHRELSKLKTTQYSEAEEEIMELEEDEVENKWFHDLQVMWAGIASVGGIMVLYRGGVLWERWIVEQERKDREEEIELTGTFIDPRAVRKEEGGEDDDAAKKKKGGGDGPDDSPPDADDLPPGGIDALEKLFGKS